MKGRSPFRTSRAPRLFSEPGRPADAYVAHVDGASRNNPGPAAYGAVIRRPDGTAVQRLSKYIGVRTNNEAEYFGLIAALDYSAGHGVTKLRVRSDSELLVRQMRGQYKVKSAALRPLHERARKAAQALAYFAIEHVPREQNREADALANEALDRSSDVAAPFTGPSASADLKVAATRLRKDGETRTIRARYSKGALHPAEPVDLAEGEEIEITIQRLAPGSPRRKG